MNELYFREDGKETFVSLRPESQIGERQFNHLICAELCRCLLYHCVHNNYMGGEKYQTTPQHTLSQC